jgi:molybdate transport system substrate-binding protein
MLSSLRPFGVLLFAGALLTTGCASREAPTVSLFAAMSTREAVEEVARRYEAETGVRVRCSLAATSTLARQIEHGADADLLLSADQRWADYLDERDLAREKKDLLANRLVVVVPADSKLRLDSLKDLVGGDIERLAVALDAVPAGRYAHEALQKAGVWERLRDRVIEGRDVRATLTYVARGEVDAGVVYATDAAASSEVRIALEVPEELHTPIRYPLVIIRRDPVKKETLAFAEYLRGEEAAKVFLEAGFRTLP